MPGVPIRHVQAGNPRPDVCPECGHVVDWDHPEYFGGRDYDAHKEVCTFCGRHPLKDHADEGNWPSRR